MNGKNKKTRKGIVLAGGLGSRLFPITSVVSKQLLPIFDKPMIFYPLTTLMAAGIKEILIITTPQDQDSFKKLLGNGERWGVSIEYSSQEEPRGLAEAFIIGEDFLDGSPSCLILGDNLFFGHQFSEVLKRANEVHEDINENKCTIFGYRVSNPESFGVAEFNDKGDIINIEEKPSNPVSPFAIVGLYFLNSDASYRAKLLKPSLRGELEITDLLNTYIVEKNINFEKLGRGFAWFDTGTPVALLDAANFVRNLSERQNVLIGSPEEQALTNNWIDNEQLEDLINYYSKSKYGQNLKKVFHGPRY